MRTIASRCSLRRAKRCYAAFSTHHDGQRVARPHEKQFTLALARNVPESFPAAVTAFADSTTSTDLFKAIQQHDAYLEVLRKYVPTICLPPIDDLPDSVFVEDTVVAIGNRALITNPGHPSRRPEVESVKTFLQQLGMDVIDMRDYKGVLCDGGDVLYTDKEMFVGVSTRTNEAAVKLLEESFRIPVSPVYLENKALHLKSLITHVDDETLIAPTGDHVDDLLRSMRVEEKGYECHRLPNQLACNVITVNNGLLAQVGECRESKEKLSAIATERNMQVEFIDMSEKAKCDGALTCCSVLLRI